MRSKDPIVAPPCGAGLPLRGRAARGSGLLDKEQWEQLAWLLDISPRELGVLQGVFDGLTDHAIASRLGITRGTVHTYSTRLRRKVGVSTRAELVVAALSQAVQTPRSLYTQLYTRDSLTQVRKAG